MNLSKQKHPKERLSPKVRGPIFRAGDGPSCARETFSIPHPALPHQACLVFKLMLFSHLHNLPGCAVHSEMIHSKLQVLDLLLARFLCQLLLVEPNFPAVTDTGLELMNRDLSRNQESEA